MYCDCGRISRPAACCSMTWAVQPAVRPMREGRREEVRGQPDVAQQQRGVELDVGVQVAARLRRRAAPGRRPARLRCARSSAARSPVSSASSHGGLGTAPRRADRAPCRRGGRSPSAACPWRSRPASRPRRGRRVPISSIIVEGRAGRAAVQRPLERADGAGHRRDHVRGGRGDDARGERRGVHAVVGDGDEVGVQALAPWPRPAPSPVIWYSKLAARPRSARGSTELAAACAAAGRWRR